jgi:GntR family transcriptional repressor for pyruvate dehydrogenase complex
MPSFAALERRSVGLQAEDAIKSLILSGQLLAGDVLPPERDLAAMLGISRPSLREAIRALTALNVLQPRHGGGTYVSSLDARLLSKPINFILRADPTNFEFLFEVRKVLEVGAARLAAAKITDEEVAELAQLADDSGRALSRPSRYMSYDVEIHSKIIEVMANPIYLSFYESIIDLSIESRRRTTRITAVRQQAHLDHLAIVSALRDRDPDAAAQAMSDHLSSTRLAILSLKEANR